MGSLRVQFLFSAGSGGCLACALILLQDGLARWNIREKSGVLRPHYQVCWRGSECAIISCLRPPPAEKLFF